MKKHYFDVRKVTRMAETEEKNPWKNPWAQFEAARPEDLTPDSAGIIGAIAKVYALLGDMKNLLPDVVTANDRFDARMNRHEDWLDAREIRAEANADERLREQTASWLLAAIVERPPTFTYDVKRPPTFTYNLHVMHEPPTPQQQAAEAVMMADLLRAELARTRAAETAKQEAVLDGATAAAKPGVPAPKHPYTEYHDAAQKLAETVEGACATIDGLGDENISSHVERALKNIMVALRYEVKRFYDAGKRCVPVDDPEAP